MKYLRTAAGLLLAVLLLGNAALADYRFDDLGGPSGISAQWLIIGNTGNTYGGSHTTAIDVSADLTSGNDTTPLLHLRSGGSDTDTIDTMFMVMAQEAGAQEFTVNFGGSYFATPSVGLGTSNREYSAETPYSSRVRALGQPSGQSYYNALWRSYQMEIYKQFGSDSTYDTVRQVIGFHQNPDDISSQTIYKPLIIANVSTQTATEVPLQLRMTLRENSASGNIVAYNIAKWRVNERLETGGNDWVFVPVDDLGAMAKQNYSLTTEVANHTAYRYAAQNPVNGDWVFPYEWRFDLPKYQGTTDIPRSIALDGMSHIAPGLVSVYRRTFDITEENKRPLRLFAVDDDKRNGEWDLVLNHNIIYGQKLGLRYEGNSNNRYNDYEITPYLPRWYNNDFNKVLAYEMSSDYSAVTVPSNVSLTPSITHNASGMPADAIRYFTLNHTIPGNVRRSYNTEGILPLHITMNIPVTQIRNREWYNEMLTEWRNEGSIERTFKANFEICLLADTFGENNPWNLSEFLDARGKYEEQIHVFLDEDRGTSTSDNAPGLITVSFIVYMMDGTRDGVRPEIKLVKDKLSTSEHDYIVIRDGTYDDKWQMTFFVMPTGAITNNESNNNPSKNNNASGGGGCNAGISLIALMLCGLMFRRKSALVIMLLVMVMSFPAYGFTVKSNIELKNDSGDVVLKVDGYNYSTFQELIDSIDVIVNDESFDVDETPYIELSGQVSITDAVNFRSIEELEIRQGRLASSTGTRILEINTDITLSFDQVTFTGGGVSVSAGTVNIASCTFNDNSNTNGGALEVTGGSVNISGSTFRGNNADSGGAIYISDGTVNLSGRQTFSGNTSTGDGGAIYSKIALTFEGSPEFSGNSASGNGGAIYAFDGITFSTGAAFTGNTASGDGGAVYTSGTSSFTGVTFGSIGSTRNSAANGGAVYVNADTSTFSNTSFAQNSADYGGAIYIASNGTCQITTDTDYTSNNAVYGGVIYTLGTFTASGTHNFSTNTAAYGGSIYVNSGTSRIEKANFTGNTADYGGSIYVNSGSLTFTGTAAYGSDISPNSASYGGAVYISGGTLSYRSKATFSYNTASINGGAILVSGDTATLTFTTSADFTGNSAVSDGGAIYWHKSSSPSFASGTSFTSNSAENGGAIYLISALTLTDTNGYIFRDNTASGNGGAIYTQKALTLNDFTQSDPNEASECGGFAYVTGKITLTSADISHQTGKNGGALYGAGDITIDGSRLHENTSDTSENGSGGGAVYASGSLTITGSDFYGNTHASSAGGSNEDGGGAVYAKGPVDIRSSRFYDNRSTNHNGGAVLALNASSVSITTTLFSQDEAAIYGGAVSIRNVTSIAISKTTFYENIANGNSGGALHVAESSTLSISEAYFYHNRAFYGDGGAIYFDSEGSGKKLTLTKSVFVSNLAARDNQYTYGGAAYIRTETAEVSLCTFNGNIASNSGGYSRGGAIYINVTDAVGKGTLQDSTFAGNKALGSGQGGALCTLNAVSVTSCTFTLENEAENGYGGAIYVAGGTLTMTANIAVGNKARIGNDVYASTSGKIRSGEYNRIGYYSQGNSTGTIKWSSAIDNNYDYDVSAMQDDEGNTSLKWDSTTFFGSNELADNETEYDAVGYLETMTIQTVALAPNVSLPASAQAIDIIPSILVDRYTIAEYDQRGLRRPSPEGGYIDAGAYELKQSAQPNENGDIQYNIASVKMSGIPNTLKSPGQTVSLIAIVTYENGITRYGGNSAGEEPVKWSSTNASRLSVDQYGNLIAGLNQSGTAIITVEVVRPREDGSKAADSRIVVVDTIQATEMNIATEFANIFRSYNEERFEYDMNISYAENTSTSVMSSAFASIWNVLPSQLQASSYSEPENISSNTQSGVKLSFSEANTGSILPLTFTWTLDTPYTGTAQAMAEKIFAASHIDFNDDIIIGSNGIIDINEALNCKALSLTPYDHNTQIALTACLANVSSTGTNQQAQIVSGFLIIPDGNSDNTLSGSMILVTPEGNNNPDSSSSSGGGGGCNALSLGLLCAVILFLRK